MVSAVAEPCGRFGWTFEGHFSRFLAVFLSQRSESDPGQLQAAEIAIDIMKRLRLEVRQIRRPTSAARSTEGTTMRAFYVSLCLSLIIGCGSETPTQPAATSDQSGGITLSVPNPTAQTTRASELPSLSPEEQQVIDQLIVRARQAVETGQTMLAIEALSQAIGMDPADPRLFRMRADAYSLIGELASARADFSAAIMADPVNAELRNLRGYFLMKCGAREDAMKDFSEALRMDPKLAIAWNNRGLVYLQQSEYRKAEQEFQTAVEKDDEYADGWNNLGFVKMKQGRNDEALRDIERALELNPDYVAAWNNRGLIYLEAKDYEAACTAFTRAIELSDLDPRWYAHRQVALRELKRYDEAAADERRIAWISRLSHLNQNLNQDVQDASRWVARGEWLLEGQKNEAAANDFTNALKLEPDNTAALNGRARVWASMGRLQKAIDDCEQSIVIEPTLEALSIRGEAWLAMDHLDQAIADFEASSRMDETFVTAYRRRAEERRRQGDDSAAEEDLEAARRIEDALAGRLASGNEEPIPFPDSE